MSSVYLCSPTNSTMFTTCCNVAILEREKECPKCADIIYPFEREDDQFSENDIRRLRWSKAYHTS